jgi:hypothetical protein
MHGGMAMKFFYAVLLFGFMGNCHASDSWSSELSHATGGALLAGAATRLYSDSENGAWIGFAISSAGVVLAESYQISRGAKRSSSYLDMASHIAGAALGAWWMDKYGLMPVIGHRSVGLVIHRQF